MEFIKTHELEEAQKFNKHIEELSKRDKKKKRGENPRQAFDLDSNPDDPNFGHHLSGDHPPGLGVETEQEIVVKTDLNSLDSQEVKNESIFEKNWLNEIDQKKIDLIKKLDNSKQNIDDGVQKAVDQWSTPALAKYIIDTSESEINKDKEFFIYGLKRLENENKE
jgi:hypothetical protein